MSDALSPELASLSLTHVYYNPHSTLSLLSAYLSLTPQALLLAAVSMFYATREAELALYILGQLLCEATNMVLKRVFRQPRPAQVGEGYGMPSSHAQFMGYFGVYVGLVLAVRGVGALRGLRRVGYVAVVVGVSVAVMASRVVLRYHSVEQVVAGAAVGAGCGAGWFAVTRWVRGTRWGERGVLAGVTGGRRVWVWAVECVGGLVWMRDTAVGRDVVEEGWREWREAEKRKRG